VFDAGFVSDEQEDLGLGSGCDWPAAATWCASSPPSSRRP